MNNDHLEEVGQHYVIMIGYILEPIKHAKTVLSPCVLSCPSGSGQTRLLSGLRQAQLLYILIELWIRLTRRIYTLCT